MHLDLSGRRALRRVESGEWVIALGERRAEPGNVELGGDEVSLDTVPLSRRHRRIEFDQAFAGAYLLAVMDKDGPHDAGFQRLDQLGSAAGNDLSVGRDKDVDFAGRRPGQRDAEEGNDGP